MKLRKTIATILFSIAAFSLNETFAQTPVERRDEAVYFGMQSLAVGQSLRLNIENPKPLVIRDLEPCLRVRIVIDAYAVSTSDAARLRFVRRTERTMTLDAGEATSLDLTRAIGERFSVSVFIVPVEGSLPAGESINAHATLETRLLERTIFTFPGVIKGFNPQPEPPV